MSMLQPRRTMIVSSGEEEDVGWVAYRTIKFDQDVPGRMRWSQHKKLQLDACAVAATQSARQARQDASPPPLRSASLRFWYPTVILCCFLLWTSQALVMHPLPESNRFSLSGFMSCTTNEHVQPKSLPRRTFVESLILTPTTTAAAAVVTTTIQSRSAHAAVFSKDRRQLELCLVAVQRVVYWAQSLAADLSNPDLSTEKRKQRYLEARLAAKSILTGKIGGGANYKVYTLSTLQIPGCLQDLEAYASSARTFGETSREFYEALASMVEFDGMDTLTDPSPRSSLTLTQYDTKKETYIRRILLERVVPLGIQVIHNFPSNTVAISERYIQQNFPDEVFPRLEESQQ